MAPLDQLLAQLPDIPRWVELRAELIDQSAILHGTAEHGVVREGDGQTLYALGAPSRQILSEALRAAPTAELLAAPESQPHLAQVLGAAGTRASLSRLLHPERLPADGETRLLGPRDGQCLASLPADLRDELTQVLQRGPLAVALCAGVPVSFCYAGAVSETLWDISIDTLAPYRRRGFAGQAVSAMVRHMRGLGRPPVWGAAEDNPASFRLAEKLGFAVVDHLFVFPNPLLAPLLAPQPP